MSDQVHEPRLPEAGEDTGVGKQGRFEGQSRAARRATGLAEVALALGRADSVDDVVNAVVFRGFGVLEAASGGIALRTASGGGLEVRVTGHYEQNLSDSITNAPADADWPMTVAARTGEAFFLPDPAALAARFPDAVAAAQGVGAQAIASLPLEVDGRILGSINIAWDQPRHFDIDDRALADALAAQCAQALDRIQVRDAERHAVEELHQSQRQLGLLLEVTSSLTASLDLDEALSRMCRTLVATFADWVVVTVVDGNGTPTLVSSLHAEGHRDILATYPSTFGDLGPQSATRRVLHGGEAVFQPQLDGAATASLMPDEEQRAGWDTLGGRSLIVVPLVAPHRTVGTIALVRGHSGRHFSHDDLQIAIDLGRRAGQAVDNARLYAESREISESLQRSMLSEPVAAPRIEVIARYHPAAAQAEVGGDWYDSFVQPNGDTVLVIGDVMGHDMHAAAAMGQLRTLLRGVAYDRHDLPAGILTRADVAIRGLGIDTLATCIVATIHHDDDRSHASGLRVSWSNAGHPPAVLVAPDGTSQLLEAESELFLGLDADTARTDHSTDLTPGHTLLLFTDGLVERRGTLLTDGYERLRDSLTDLAAMPLDELCDSLLARVLPDGHDDDAALLAVRVRP